MMKLSTVAVSRLLALSLSLFALVSCTSFDFERQVIALRHVPHDDVLEMRIAYLGLNPGEAKPAAAAQAVAGIAEGARHILLFGWPFEFHVDLLIGAADEDPAYSAASQWLSELEIVESGYFIDERGAANAWQVVRFPRVRHGFELVNGAIDRMLAEELEAPQDLIDDDPELTLLFREAIRDGFEWIALSEGRLCVAFPTTPGAAARFLRDAASEDDGFLDACIGHLATFEMRDGTLSLGYEADPDGWIAFDVSFDERSRRPTEKARQTFAERLSASVEPSPERPTWVRELER